VLFDVQRGQQFVGACPGLAPAQSGELGRQQHVVGDRQVIEQVEELEDHSDAAPPEPGYPGLTQPVHALPGHRHGATGRLVQACDEVEQR